MTQKYVAGIDEAGRGPLAGPVSVSVVIMPLDNYSKIKSKIRSLKWLTEQQLLPLKDSKKLSEKQREKWLQQIITWKSEGLLDFSNCLMSDKEIDQKGISTAIRNAIRKILYKFQDIHPEDINLMLDGALSAPAKYSNQKTIIKGDELEPIISLASIISKVKRDHKMSLLAREYPKYAFEIHKGYGTVKHISAIHRHGLSAIHRKTFCTNLPK